MNDAVKTDTALGGVIKGETSTGFSFSYPKQNLDNMELVEAMGGAIDGDPLKMPLVLNLLIGKEEKKALYDHVREKDGRVSIKKISNELVEMCNSNKETKN
ncbi:MAG: hypothetical protein LKE48_03215 [Solobacterium sp.]|jgi:hypothetical protein|nr:hypothetical protein [Solobacterium sp.]MCH4281514.1 hypothetical protein [Solobacterium sp.]